MENKKNLFGSFSGIFFTIIIVSGLLFLAVGCNNNESVVSPEQNDLTLEETLRKITEEDEAIQSFVPNYNESGALDFLAKTNGVIYPARVWQKIESVDFNLDLTVDGDTAYGFSTKTINGTLFIAASFDEFNPGDSAIVDTVIEKPFTSTVTRNIIYERRADTGNDRLDWKVVAISLPEGGTGSTNINITKMTVYLSDGEVIEVTSPNDYYLTREKPERDSTGNGGHRGRLGRGKGSGFPSFGSGDSVRVVLELESAYSDTDYVSLTYGANKFGRHRAKRRFELISSDFNGSVYNKVFEGNFTAHHHKGFFHAIVNAVPYQVINDDVAPVEKNSWGMPYKVE